MSQPQSAAQAVKPGRARRILFTAIAALAVAGVAASAILISQPTDATAGPKPVTVETSTIARGDLSEKVRTQGTLSYSSPRDLGTSLSGIVTGLPVAGSTITQGGELFRVDDGPVMLLHGDLPVWRPFALGMSDGADVLQLERSLAALGYFEREPDEEFAESTEAAVEKWQKALGLEKTGTLELGRIVFLAGDVRIQASKAAIGDPASEAIVSATGTNKQVLAYLDPADHGIAAVGGIVDVIVPGGQQTPATVVAVGTPVEREGSNGTTIKIPVTLTLNEPDVAAALDNVAVSVLFVRNAQSDVLLVPVGALLAQPGGGFAVEAITGPGSGKGQNSASKIVVVELGTFADGFVAVTGGALAEGDTVVVAK